jgi:hypothetical protein
MSRYTAASSRRSRASSAASSAGSSPVVGLLTSVTVMVRFPALPRVPLLTPVDLEPAMPRWPASMEGSDGFGQQ